MSREEEDVVGNFTADGKFPKRIVETLFYR